MAEDLTAFKKRDIHYIIDNITQLSGSHAHIGGANHVTVLHFLRADSKWSLLKW